MTESEAKEKWCPLVRQLGTLLQPAKPGGADYVVAAGSQNRGYQMGGPLDNCRCIASACMAWRWNDPKPEIQIFVRGEDDAGFVKRRDRILAARTGFCGAFGPAIPPADRQSEAS